MLAPAAGRIQICSLYKRQRRNKTVKHRESFYITKAAHLAAAEKAEIMEGYYYRAPKSHRELLPAVLRLLYHGYLKACWYCKVYLAGPPVSDRQALFVGDILATGCWAADISEIKPEDTVLVIGAGPTGLCTLQCVLLKGPKQVIVCEKDTQRRAFAEKHYPQMLTAHLRIFMNLFGRAASMTVRMWRWR